MRVLIYSRYSTEKQNENSTADQIRICQARASSLGEIGVVTAHSDDGVSGSIPVASRPGGAALLADLESSPAPTILLVEDLSRLSRDQVEQERIVRRLEHRGVRIVGVSDGYDSENAARKIHRGVRGLLNEVYLDDLREKTRRGLAGQVLRGFNAGGLSYGYKSVPASGGNKLEIVSAEAKWVVWIFERYAEGWSTQRIAAALNRLSAPSPRGSTWAVSAIYGSPKKGTGILNNVLYSGRYVWNRSRWEKDPDTGVRKRIERPESEWQVIERPDLKIVADDLWRAARGRMDTPRLADGNKGRGARPKTLLGGLLKCGVCGGAVVAVSSSSYGCCSRKDRGAVVCRGVAVPRRQTEVRLLSLLRDDLLSPVSIAEMKRQVGEVLAERSAASSRSVLAGRVKELDGEIARLVDAVAKMGFSEALAVRLKRAETERASLASELSKKAPQPVKVDDLVPRYRALVLDLQTALSQDTSRARGILRNLFGEIKIVQEGKEVYAEASVSPARVLIAAGGGPSSLGLVAGAGFEPAAFGL